jgi:hypothetical protein
MGSRRNKLEMTNPGSIPRTVQICHLSFVICNFRRAWGEAEWLFQIFLYATPVSPDGFRRETRGCRDAKAECAGSAGCSRP